MLRSANVARTVFAMGLQVNQVGNARISAGAPSKRTLVLRMDSSKDKPIQMGAYPYPIYSVYANQSEADVYMLTKALIEGYDGYKDNAPGASGLTVKGQTRNWAVPVHKGAVKAFKEAGAWSGDQEKYNNALFKRQEVLIAAWTDYMKGSPASDPAKLTEEWMSARKAALAKAGMVNTFE